MAAGATAADAIYVGDRSSGVQVRLGELEDVSRSEGEGMGLRLFIGQRSATVASSDLSDEVLAALVDRCLSMAQSAPQDPFAGLAPPELLLTGDLPFIDTVDEREPDPTELRERALEAEKASMEVDGVTNSNGGSASASGATVALATSSGFSGAYSTTGHGCSASVIAGEGTTMQRDYAWHSARHLEDLLAQGGVQRAAQAAWPSRSVDGSQPVGVVRLDVLAEAVGAGGDAVHEARQVGLLLAQVEARRGDLAETRALEDERHLVDGVRRLERDDAAMWHCVELCQPARPALRCRGGGGRPAAEHS